MAMTIGPVRPMRADARRNYQRLLDAARAAFAEHGTDAPLDDIAKRAGVGSGTLYRHFPTRLDLVEAVFRDRMEGMLSESAGLLEQPDALAALQTFLRMLIAQSTTYRGLAGALRSVMDEDGSALGQACHLAVNDAAGRLLDRAKQQGAIRADVNLRDLLKLVNGIALASEQELADPELSDRLLAMVTSGIHA